MVKKYIPKQKEEDEELSDLEMDTGENEEVEAINETERLLHLRDKIKEDFTKQYKAKGKNPSWLETLTETSTEQINPNLDIDDDIKRELIFYNISIGNTMKVLRELKNVFII
jgi:hypothetical protein